MGKTNEQRLDEEQRLLAVREYLGVRAKPQDANFDREVVEAAIAKVRPLIEARADYTGEEISAAIAGHLSVHFEEVRSSADIVALEQKYLVERRELGFGLLAHELADPSVDALLFQRMHAAPNDPDHWVAVMNLQETEARGYWNRAHEMVHRLAEPPQKRLAFFRHRTDQGNRIERIIDLGAAELAFPKEAFGLRVQVASREPLTWDLVQSLRQEFAPTASLQSAAKAVIRYWPKPVFLLKAASRGRRGKPHIDVALRVDVEDFNAAATRKGIRFFPNMRVPVTSPIRFSYESARSLTGYEDLGQWITSTAQTLPVCQALTSSLYRSSYVYGLVSLT
jgi:hypothetical protein